MATKIGYTYAGNVPITRIVLNNVDMLQALVKDNDEGSIYGYKIVFQKNDIINITTEHDIALKRVNAGDTVKYNLLVDGTQYSDSSYYMLCSNVVGSSPFTIAYKTFEGNTTISVEDITVELNDNK